MGWFVGLDLGQAADPSALAVVEVTREAPLPTIPGKVAPPGPRRLDCRALKRWPLGTSYTSIVADLGGMLAKAPLSRCTLVVDASGCGRPVIDLIRQAKLSAELMPVVITAGLKESFTDGYAHVAKAVLISNLQVLLQARRLRFAAGLPETAVLVKELQDYRVRVTPAANEVWSAREGAHDDLVLALALACWRGEREPEPGFAPYMLGTACVKFDIFG